MVLARIALNFDLEFAKDGTEDTLSTSMATWTTSRCKCRQVFAEGEGAVRR
jgi:hypothetical protein